MAIARRIAVVAALSALMAACGSSPSSPSGKGPAVRSIAPRNGTTFGATPVTITGSGFTGATSVAFGGKDATEIVVMDSNTINAKTPVHTAGSVDVEVKVSATSSGALRQGFTFTTPTVENLPPQLTSLTAQGSRANEPTGYANLSSAMRGAPQSVVRERTSASIG
jgi:hypothetical protein